MADYIYLDHNATTPLLREVADAIRDASLRFAANPGSQHGPGRVARQALESARTRIAELLGACTAGTHADRLIFTSGGTEANNLLFAGVLSGVVPGHLITSQIEHPSVLGPVAHWEQQGWRVTRVGADSSGVVRVAEIAEAMDEQTQLVSIMAANNETGVLQPLAEIGELCQNRGVALHTDAAQQVGKLPLNFSSLKLSALSCAAHKFHGPLGIGAIVVKRHLPLSPLMYGGYQQAGTRPGTEMVSLAIGMQVALESWHRTNSSRLDHLLELQRTFETCVLAEIPSAVVLGANSPRLPNTSNVAFPGVDRQAFFLALDIAGVACSTGSACASGSSEVSPTHLAMGVSQAVAEGAVRFSWGATTTRDEVCEAAQRIIKVHNQLR